MTDDAQGLMDRMYRPQRHIYDLTRKHYLLGRDQLIDRLNPPEGGAVLEIGCGTGRNLIRAARLYPRVGFYGVDISAVMLDEAKASISRNKVAAPIALAQGDAALELLAEELRLAHVALGEITGAFSADDLLGEIFSRFCIGK